MMICAVQMMNSVSKLINFCISNDELCTGTLWKLLMGDTFMAAWTGPQYPNRPTMTDTCFGNGAQFNFSDCIAHCGRGCLYDLTNDAEERVDLALKQPERVEHMLARVDSYHRTAFLPERCVQSKLCPDEAGEHEQRAGHRHHGRKAPSLRY